MEKTVTKVEELTREVQKLDCAELIDFRKWFEEYTADMWDQQIEEDVQAGKLDHLAQAALAEHYSGKTRTF